jgi:hypothetical protein
MRSSTTDVFWAYAGPGSKLIAKLKMSNEAASTTLLKLFLFFRLNICSNYSSKYPMLQGSDIVESASSQVARRQEDS